VHREHLAEGTIILDDEQAWGHRSVLSSVIAAFQEAGYDAQQVLEVVLGVGMKTLSNYTNHIAGTELDAAFQHRAWRASEAG